MQIYLMIMLCFLLCQKIKNSRSEIIVETKIFLNSLLFQ